MSCCLALTAYSANTGVSVSDSCMKKKCVYRPDSKASRVILTEAITQLVRSAEKPHGST